MRLSNDHRQLHLTYGTNVHAAETLAEVRAVMAGPVAQVKALLGLPRLGVGLRLSAAAADELARDRTVLDSLRQLSARLGLYHFTLNAFPYGGFHAARVKEQVFEPAWFVSERARYTKVCADVLAGLLPDGVDGSISTLAGGFKPRQPSEARALLARHLLEVVRHLHAIHSRTGRVITVALEPEPFTTLETIPELVAFVTQVLDPAARSVLPAPAIDIVRRHLGVCYDACHQAVQYEDPRDSLARLAQAGIEVFKVQISNALEIADPLQHASALAQLKTFDEPRYLHQVSVRSHRGALTRLLDLPELYGARDVLDGAESLRVHFHVPLFAADLGSLGTTQAVMRSTLEQVLATTRCNHLEVETYTWDVMPRQSRNAAHEGSLVHGLAKEIEFVTDLLGPLGFAVTDD